MSWTRGCPCSHALRGALSPVVAHDSGLRASSPPDRIAPRHDGEHSQRLHQLCRHLRPAPPKPGPASSRRRAGARGGRRLIPWGRLLRGGPPLRDVPSVASEKRCDLPPGAESGPNVRAEPHCVSSEGRRAGVRRPLAGDGARLSPLIPVCVHGAR